MLRFAPLLLPAWLAAAVPADVAPLPGTPLSGAAPAPVAPLPTPAVQGLRGDYYNGRNFEQRVLSRVDQRLDFNWQPGDPVGPGIDQQAFSVRWTGKLLAPADGKYKFMVNVNDGARLWVGGKLVLDEWRLETGRQYQTEIELQGGRYYDVKLEYFNGPQLGVMQLSWESPENRVSLFGLELYATPEIVPSKYLYSPPLPQRPGTVPPVVANVPGKPVRKAPDRDRATAGIPTGLSGNKAEKKGGEAPNATVVKAGLPPAAAEKREETGNAADPRETTTFEALEAGKAVVLEEVLFEQSRYRLLPSSYEQLDKLANTLLKYPHLTIEVAGHTDNVGDPRLNQALSEHRALVVTRYLQRKGVAEGRLRSKGYGGTRPVAPNTTESGRARNRRVEFRVEK